MSVMETGRPDHHSARFRVALTLEVEANSRIYDHLIDPEPIVR